MNAPVADTADFGPFADICRNGGYLRLLWMSPDAVAVVKGIATIVGSTVEPQRYVARLLHDRNWRGHLIALTAVLVSDESARHAAALWTCFDRGSWVAPQLGVALYCCDPGFGFEAKRRIAARCPIVDDDDFFRGQTRHASAKNLATLLRVVDGSPSETAWAARERHAPDVEELLKADHDSAGEIVEKWLNVARARFRECGRSLDPAG